MSIGTFLKRRLTDLLEEHRIVVWFDGEGHFEEFAKTFKARGTKVILAGASPLQARRAADTTVASFEDPGNPECRSNLLLYLPWERGKSEKARYADPFEGLAIAGAAFGDKDVERLQALARQALPHMAGEIDRLFAEGKPTLAMLEELAEGGAGRFPLLRAAFGSDLPLDAAERAFVDLEASPKLQAVEGAFDELLRLLQQEFGFEPPAGATDPLAAFGRYILFSEFALDLEAELPAPLDTLPCTEPRFRQRVYDLCDRIRSSNSSRERYAKVAATAEADLDLAAHFPDPSVLGHRDTFPFEESAWLGKLVNLAREGGLAEAREILEGRKGSLWIERGTRAVLWKVAERCLDLLEVAARFQGNLPRQTSPMAWVTAYGEPDGLHLLDLHQRRMEQAVALGGEDEEIAALVAQCRRVHRNLTEKVQEAFLGVVAREGWPPDGALRQTQVFDRFVAPSLEDRRRTAYFLVDAFRFEMGADLRSSLEDLGEVALHVAATVLPASTAFGMAALMPGADGAFSLLQSGGDLVPAVRGRALPDSASRMDLLKETYGDRFDEMTLEKLLSLTPPKIEQRLKGVDLVVLRTQDLDAMAEGIPLYQARRHMGLVLEDLRVACERLAHLGFQRIVLASDHGHVLLNEFAPGDVVSESPGDWDLSKRRCRLGRHRASSSGVLILSAAKMGIVGPIEEFAVPTGFRLFKAGEGYFHEGLSLQECVIPVLVVDVAARTQERGRPQISLSYRSDRITSRVISIRSELTSLYPDVSEEVRIQVFDGTGAKAKVVGEAADCDSRNPATGLITLTGNQQVQIPLRIHDDFSGNQVEVRVLDVATGNVLARLKLGCVFMD